VNVRDPLHQGQGGAVLPQLHFRLRQSLEEFDVVKMIFAQDTLLNHQSLFQHRLSRHIVALLILFIGLTTQVTGSLQVGLLASRKWRAIPSASSLATSSCNCLAASAES